VPIYDYLLPSNSCEAKFRHFRYHGKKNSELNAVALDIHEIRARKIWSEKAKTRFE